MHDLVLPSAKYPSSGTSSHLVSRIHDPQSAQRSPRLTNSYLCQLRATTLPKDYMLCFGGVQAPEFRFPISFSSRTMISKYTKMFNFQFPKSASEISFQPLSQTDSSSYLSPESKDIESFDTSSHLSSHQSFSSHVCPVLLLCVALTTSAVLGAYFGSSFFTDTNRLCIHRVSKYCELNLKL